MTTNFAGHLLGPGTHAARPAAGTVPYGTLYSCTDHALIYQNEAGTWETWAILGGDVAAHLADATDAHDASAVSIVDTGAYFTGTEVEAALQELGAASGGGAAFAGARARMVADQALTNGSLVYIPFDTEDYDTDGFHSTVTNPSRFTVPTGLGGKYDVKAAGFATASVGNGDCVLRVNGSTFVAMGWMFAHAAISGFGVATTLDLAQGDYVEWGVRVAANGKSLTDGGGSADPFLSMEKVG